MLLLRFYAIVAILFVSTSVFASSLFSEEALRILSRHAAWQTIVYSKMPMGSGFQATPSMQKKWIYYPSKGIKGSLKEKTELSVTVTADRKIGWSAEVIDLSQPIDIEKFALGRNKGQDWTFNFLGDDSFSIKTSDDSFHIIFLPAKNGPYAARIRAPLKRIHAGTAPLGFSDDSFRRSGIVKAPTHYLHHDLTRQKEVWISPGFPKKYFNVVRNSFRKWNKALGANLFPIRFLVQDIDQEKCLSKSVICLTWYGPEDIPWSGMMALTSISFDPENGEIIGGIISVNNLAPLDMTSTPPEIISEASQRDPGINWVARRYLEQDRFIHYKHPFGSQSLEYFLLHETGHYIGLQHNFAGSRHGDFQHPTDSIMDYLPFTVNFKANEIGKFDQAILDLVYRGRKPDLSYEFCDAYQFSGPEWAPYCDQKDLGDTIKWYSALAAESPDGFLTSVNFVMPDFKQISEPIVEVIAKYLALPEGNHAKEALCKNTQAKNYLQERQKPIECQ